MKKLVVAFKHLIKDLLEEMRGNPQVLTDLPLNLNGIQGQPLGPRTAVSNGARNETKRL